MASYFERESADTKLSRFGLSILAHTAVVAKLEYTKVDLQVICSCMLQKHPSMLESSGCACWKVQGVHVIIAPC